MKLCKSHVSQAENGGEALESSCFLQTVQVRYTNGYCDILIKGCNAYLGMTPVFPAGVMMSRQTLDPMVCTRGYARLTEDQLGGGVM